MDKSKGTVVKKIVLQVRGKEISLTVEEAKELKQILADMFGKEVIIHERTYPWLPWPYINIPYTVWGVTTSTTTETITTNATGTVWLTANATT